jgi:hypothetical protein
MLSKKEQFNIETNLILMLIELCTDCMLYLGVDEKYIIADVLFKGKFALGRIVDCNHIHQVIKDSGTNRLSPKEVFKRFVDKGWIEDVD